MKKLLMQFIERGWIEPSDSEWASPAFIVPKKERGEWRLVVDYRGLNEPTEHDSYSLSLIDSILQKQQKMRIFTVLDLKHGYHQMPLHEDSMPCTAMSTPLGPMQWKVVPMGAKNGNAAFQSMMKDLLQPVRDCADPFVDDIIIGSGTKDMTDDELIEAHECNYEANPRYCTFANTWSTPCQEPSTCLYLCTVLLLCLVHETSGTIYILQLMVALLC